VRAAASASNRQRLRSRRWYWRFVRLPSTPVLLETGVVALAIAVFLIVGRLYAAPPMVAFDDAGLAGARALRSAPLDAVVPAITSLGSEALWFVWPPMAVALIWLRRLPSAAALVVVALGVHVLNDTLKAMYQRARPTELEGVVGAQAFSFPSGHAMAAGAIYGMLALVGWRELRGPLRWSAIGVCLVSALAVAFSRVYLGLHYPTDVLAGLLSGALWADIVVLGWRLAATAIGPPSVRGRAG
jgi:undecaprenyl-diphosphatase